MELGTGEGENCRKDAAPGLKAQGEHSRLENGGEEPGEKRQVG